MKSDKGEAKKKAQKPEAEEPLRLITAREAARRLGIDRTCLWRLSGKYPAFAPYPVLGMGVRRYLAGQVRIMAAALIGEISPEAALAATRELARGAAR